MFVSIMKKQTKKKSAPTPEIEPVPPVATAVSVQSSGIVVQNRGGTNSYVPSPDELLDEAEEETNHRDLATYFPVIVKLREKGFSFREIAVWLVKRNVEADHNAVYRVYTRLMTVDEAELEEELEQEERDLS